MDIVIELATLSETKIIVDLLNNATLDLHKKGINQWEYPWDEKEIKEDIIKENVFVLKTTQIIGTFSIRKEEAFKGNYIYRIALLPNFQGENLGKKIVEYAVKLSKKANTVLYLDCWSGNTKLQEFYLDCGFEYQYDLDELDYKVSVFKKE